MSLLHVNLLDLLNVYLILTLFLGIFLRYRQYRATLTLLATAPMRWPKLFQLVTEHRTLFLTWPTLVPLGLTLLLTLVNSIALHLIWPHAVVTSSHLGSHWFALILIAAAGAAMLAVDYKMTFWAWEMDAAATAAALDQAEYWLNTPWAPAIRILTFGFVNPRQMVREEVRKALTAACGTVNRSLWQWSLQIAVRFAFGMTLWLTWAWTVHDTAAVA